MKGSVRVTDSKKNGKAIIAAVMSAFIWGSGQFFICKQRVKGVIFFLAQAIIIGSELLTGYWIEWASGLIPTFDLRVHGGVFTKGIWGLVTLGEVPREDHSIRLMVIGVVTLVALILFLILAIYIIKDAYKTQKAFEKSGEFISSKVYFKESLNRSFPQLVLSPMAILFLAVTVMPIISTILVAFTDYSKNSLPPANIVEWVGFDNFIKLFNVPIWTSTFFSILLWTLIWAVSVSLLSYFFGLFQAVLLNNIKGRMKKVYQSILILPWAVPSLVTLLYFRTILNQQFGQLNEFLKGIGLIDESIPFLTDPLIAKIVLIAVAVFLSFPTFMVMMLGVLSSANKSWYEAATIDGANRWHQFRYITLPHVFSATAPLLIMNFSFNFNGFGTIYFLTDGGPVNSAYQFAGHTDILISWIYDLTLNQQQFAMASVMSILIFIFLGAISVWNLRRTAAFKQM